MKKLIAITLSMLMLFGVSATAVAGTMSLAPKKAKIVTDGNLVLGTTTSTKDSGLLDYLLPYFEKQAKIKVKVISVGSGEAIAMAYRGDCDVVLVHSRALEDELLKSKFGINRKDVMYNFFYLVGPKDDPAKVTSVTKVMDAFKLISGAKSTFLSRADKSGTYTKEMAIWNMAGIKPAGNGWYKETGQGMLDTLNMASEMQGYTVTDSATWGANESKLDLKIVLQGDSALFNPYGVIEVNPAMYPGLHSKSAKAFSNFLTSPEGQKLIASYKKNGSSLFVPDYKGK